MGRTPNDAMDRNSLRESGHRDPVSQTRVSAMDVILDTNAIRASGIDSAEFKALRAYLKTTRSLLLIPSVVVEELCAQRQRAIEKLERDLETAYKDLRRLFPDTTAKPPVLDTASALSVYRHQLVTSADQVQVLKNHPEDLPELVRRLAGRLPPASPSGEEARDVLIWLAVLCVARTGRVAFITADQKAFLKSGALRPELSSELGDYRDNLEVFLRIDEFLRKYHARSSFIDEVWVKAQIETKQFDQAVEDFIDERRDIFERQIEEKGEPTGYVSLIQVVQHEAEDFFVSDLAPDELYVSLKVWAELEVEVEYYERNGDDYFRQENWSVVTKCIYPCVRMQVQFEVAGRDLVDATVTALEMA